MRVFFTLLLCLALSACSWTIGQPEAEALLEDIVATARDESPQLKGESVISMGDRVVYQEEAWFDHASPGTMLDGSLTSQGREAGGASLMLGWDELVDAVERVELVPSKTWGTETVLRAHIKEAEATARVRDYLLSELDRIRTAVQGKSEVSPSVIDTLEEEEAKLQESLNSLEVDSDYVLHVDSATYELKRLDVDTTLRYNKEGRAVEETIQSTYSAVIPEME